MLILVQNLHFLSTEFYLEPFWDAKLAFSEHRNSTLYFLVQNFNFLVQNFHSWGAEFPFWECRILGDLISIVHVYMYTLNELTYIIIHVYISILLITNYKSC